MSKRTYSSPTPGHPKRFMKMPRAEKQQPRTVLPELPTCYEEALHRLVLAIDWNMENWGTTGQWKRAAIQEREELKQRRLNALGF